MAERLSPPFTTCCSSSSNKDSRAPPLLAAPLSGSAGGRFCLLTLPHAWLTGSSPGPAALAAVLCVALGAPAALAAGSSPWATGQQRARPTAALAGRAWVDIPGCVSKAQTSDRYAPGDERGQVTTSSTTSLQGSSTRWLTFPFL